MDQEFKSNSIAKQKAESSNGAESGSLNFKVPLEFKKAFKSYAVNRGVSMVDLLKEGFELSKLNHGKD